MSPRGLWWRALLALALMAGFYALALGIVVFCYAVSTALVVGGESIPIKLVFILVVAGSVVLWSVVPRWDRFVAPGPRLDEDAHPRLFSVLREVGRATGQPVPSAVYLVDDVNAFVMNRGGWMGIGSRPIMGLGLPLLQCLSVDELRAVIAHEFGHYVGGDTRLGPWLYKTRSALVRTLQNLATAGSLLVFPFSLYLRLFLRVSHAVSRHQEFLADQVGVRVAGAGAMGTALRRVQGVAPAFGQYWRDEVVPVLVRGRRPPLAAGFAHYLSVPTIATAVGQVVAQAQTVTRDPYDTHPKLADRLAAIGQGTTSTIDLPAVPEPAIQLLGDLATAEAELIRGLLRDDMPLPEPIGWLDTGPVIYPAQWAEVVERETAVRCESISSLPALLRHPARIGATFAGVRLSDEPANRLDVARYVASIVIGHVLVQQGWDVRTLPGEPIRLVRGADERRLIDLVQAVEADDPDQWRERWNQLGVAGRLFSTPVRNR